MDASSQVERVANSGLGALPVFDRQAALFCIDGDQDFLLTLIDLALDEIPGEIVRLSVALDECNAPAVGEYAHGIKGTASAVGAMVLAQSAAQIEQQAKVGHLPETLAVRDRLNADLANFAHAVRPIS